MDVRLRGSGNGARWYGLITQGIFLAATAIGYFAPPADQASSDQSSAWVVPLIMGGLVLLMVRTLLVGTYFGSDYIRVRSWWRTYTIPLSGRPRFDAAGWHPIFYDSGESNFYRQLSSRWIEGGSRRSRRFPVLVAHQRRTLEHIAVINEFVTTWIESPSPAPALARDYARGESWARIVADIRAHRRRPIPTAIEYLGLVEHPESPPPRKRNSRHARLPDERN